MYRIFDLLIDSEIPLPELPEVAEGIASISFKLLNKPPSIKDSAWFHHWRQPDGEITISCAKDNRAYYLR